MRDLKFSVQKVEETKKKFFPINRIHVCARDIQDITAKGYDDSKHQGRCHGWLYHQISVVDFCPLQLNKRVCDIFINRCLLRAQSTVDSCITLPCEPLAIAAKINPHHKALCGVG